MEQISLHGTIKYGHDIPLKEAVALPLVHYLAPSDLSVALSGL